MNRIERSAAALLLRCSSLPSHVPSCGASS